MSNLEIVTVTVMFVLLVGGGTFSVLGLCRWPVRRKKSKPYKRYLGLGFMMMFLSIVIGLIGIIESVDENCCWDDSEPYDSWQLGN